MQPTPVSPAKQLLGKTLLNRWTVVEMIVRKQGPDATGGHFSQSYLVESGDGQRGFLKAVDLSMMTVSADPLAKLQQLANSFMFERDLLTACKAKRLNRIVTAIDSGQIGSQPNDIVFFLVFELAEGDVRQKLGRLSNLTDTWRYQVLHHVAAALQQLHSEEIAHQDLKPSNVLLFRESASKLADLGRAAAKNVTPPHDTLSVAGDLTYAPLELLYGFVPNDWGARRLGCDVYLLGSLVSSLFCSIGITSLLYSQLPPEYRHTHWTGAYSEVLPHLQQAFAESLEKIGEVLGAQATDPRIRIIRELSNPDPDLRGHPRDRVGRGSRYALQRYVTEFDLLAKRSLYSITSN